MWKVRMTKYRKLKSSSRFQSYMNLRTGYLVQNFKSQVWIRLTEICLEFDILLKMVCICSNVSYIFAMLNEIYICIAAKNLFTSAENMKIECFFENVLNWKNLSELDCRDIITWSAFFAFYSWRSSRFHQFSYSMGKKLERSQALLEKHIF